MASRKGSSESSNTGLIVALVFFVLATIGLGVGTYMGFAGKADADKAAKTAQTEKTAADKAARDERAQKLALLVAAGAAQGNDLQTFNGLRAEFISSIQPQVAKLSRHIKWDITTQGDQPPKTYEAMITELQRAVSAADNLRKAKEAELEEEKRKASESIADMQTKVKTAQDNLAKANTAVVAEQTKKGESFVEDQSKIEQLSNELKAANLAKENLDVDLKRQIKELQTKLTEYQNSREMLRANVGPIMEKLEEIKATRPELRDVHDLHELLTRQFERAQALANDSPKGQIVRVDRASGLVYINLGSADYLRPQLTFAVLPAGATGKAAAARERKGAIEVVSILEPHLSTAKVIDIVNPIRDPFLRDDLLFNPVWTPSQKEHIALAGIIDLNGDGIDDTPELVRQLEGQGVVVDAYLDLKTRTIKGPGLTEKTTYLVLGERPVSPQIVQENNPIVMATNEILGKIEEMRTKAKDVGAEPVQYRRFLTLIGHRLPRAIQPGEIGAASYLQGSSSTPKKPDNGGGRDK